MDAWKSEFLDVVNTLLGNPSSPVEMWVIVGVSLVAAIIVFDLVANGVGIPNTGKSNALIVVGVGTVVVLAAMTAAAKFLMPSVPADLHKWVLPATGLGVSLIIVVPFIKVMLKGNIINALVAWVVTALAGFAVIAIIGVGWDIVAGGGEKALGAKERRDRLQKVIDQ